MLPRSNAALDMLDSRNWPRTGPQPNATLLGRVTMLKLAGPDSRIVAIAGCGSHTVVNAALIHDEFFYRIELAGDGTVPTARAVLPGAAAWYCNVVHSELPRSPAVQAAVVQLLDGKAPLLASTPSHAPAPAFVVSDRELRGQFVTKINWALLTPAERRHFLDSLNEPTQLRARR